jgi:hypothetical protein
VLVIVTSASEGTTFEKHQLPQGRENCETVPGC